MTHDHDSLDTSNRLGPSLRRSVTRAVVVLLVAFGVYFAERQGWLKNERPLDKPRGGTSTATRPEADDETIAPTPRSSSHAKIGPASAESPDDPAPDSTTDTAAERSIEAAPRSAPPPSRPEDRNWLLIRNQTIRNEQGDVVYRGDVDLRPTVDRIERGEQASHRNDGTVFQNREGRLPRKATGYYREYVHPTPRLSGPGPQRLIIGSGKEMFYTPDHYRTFRALK